MKKFAQRHIVLFCVVLPDVEIKICNASSVILIGHERSGAQRMGDRREHGLRRGEDVGPDAFRQSREVVAGDVAAVDEIGRASCRERVF